MQQLATEAPTPDDERREERWVVTVPNVRFRMQGGSADIATVEDLSTQGFRIRWQYKVEPGVRVWVTLPGLGILPAIVRWNLEFELGCQFETPLHPSVFAHLRKALGQPA